MGEWGAATEVRGERGRIGWRQARGGPPQQLRHTHAAGPANLCLAWKPPHPPMPLPTIAAAPDPPPSLCTHPIPPRPALRCCALCTWAAPTREASSPTASTARSRWRRRERRDTGPKHAAEGVTWAAAEEDTASFAATHGIGLQLASPSAACGMAPPTHFHTYTRTICAARDPPVISTCDCNATACHNLCASTRHHQSCHREGMWV